jgi:large repetitive protein
MGIDASKLSSRIKSLVEAKRNKFRRLMCEGLERRELMAFSVLDGEFSRPVNAEATLANWSGAKDFSADLSQQSQSQTPGNFTGVLGNSLNVSVLESLKSANFVLFSEGLFSTAPGPVVDTDWHRLNEGNSEGLVGEGEGGVNHSLLFDPSIVERVQSNELVQSYFVAFASPQNVASIQSELGAIAVEPFAYLANSFNVSFDTGLSLSAATELFGDLDSVLYISPNVAVQQVARFVPNDPLFPSQWHLRNNGQTGGTAGVDAGVVNVWDNYRGDGIVIAVVDDGVEINHEDLSTNSIAGLHFDFNGNDSDPSPSVFDDHGTAVAGVAAGRGNNSIGVSGAAPNAGIAGIRLIAGPSTPTMEANAMAWLVNRIHISNNSWGPVDTGIISGIPPQVLAALEFGVTEGRDGKGIIYTWAGGNGAQRSDNVNYDRYANNRFTLAVGAIDHNGRLATYSEPGAPLIIVAPSSSSAAPGITTTDLTGAPGYSSGNYTNDFGGTSSATPLVSGVVALMLEANNNLTYRDVKDVLLRSATRNDPTDSDWVQNGAGLWVNHKYGFGAVDAEAAVALARNHVTLGTQISHSTPVLQVNAAIPDGPTGSVSTSTRVDEEIILEYVELEFNATHPNRGQLEVVLVSPTGTRSVMAERRGTDTGANYSNWVFTSARHWAESSEGNWTVIVTDRATGQTGTFNSFRLNFFGTSANTDANATQVRLLSVASNSGEIFSINNMNELRESPREITMRFDTDIDPASLAGGIRFKLAGPDGTFGANAQTITPNYLALGETPRVVVARFGQPLADGSYRIEVFGQDVAAENVTAVRSSTGNPLTTRIAGTDRDIFDFNLEVGTRIIAVVPQPIVRSAVDGSLSQMRNSVEVYFNDSELYNRPVTTVVGGANPSVVDPAFYALINTRDTVSPNDDNLHRPTSISYDPVLRRAVLTFASDIETLSGGGTFRLRVGSSEAVANAGAPQSPVVIPLLANQDPAGFLSGAFNLGGINNSFSAVVSQQIRQIPTNDPLLINYPGAKTDPGHRDIQEESHYWQPVGSSPRPDSNIEITRILYSFMDNQSYGVDNQGRPLFSVITPDQKDRVREIYEFYSAMLGIDFVEYTGPVVDNDGVHRVVVGDMFPNGYTSGPGTELGLADPAPDATLLIMDGAEIWDNSFGLGSNIPNTRNFFTATMREVGRLLGLGDSFDLPPGTIQGSEPALGRPGNPLEQIFPGNHDIVHGQHLFRPDNRDVDLYRFDIAPGTRGALRAETFAERLNNSSTLDTYISLLRQNADGSVDLISANNNYFGKDSLLEITLESGTYFLAVTVMGNQDHDPTIQNSGSGGTSQGNYQLRVDFTNLEIPQMREEVFGTTTKGSALDGDGDGIEGGDFNFWFRSVPALTQGEVRPSVNAPARAIIVDKVSSREVVSERDGSFARPFRLISEATAAARPGDVIRVVGDNRFQDLSLAQAYEIGNGGSPVGVLSDGATLNVPRGVTLVVEAGAILKFAGSKILVGSDDSTTDRSNSAIQVLGIPGLPVRFTSHFDQSLGQDTNPLNTTATPGQWGGIEIRNDFDRAQGRVDREREGIFLNSIFQSNIEFGGGRVGVGAQARPVSPIHLSEARPLIVGNSITRNADAAISIDPDSFEETLFTEPRYQQVGGFIPDYSRVGPIIYTNTIQNNSINGLFVRIDTVAGTGLKPLTAPARIDETEVVIVLGENLIINGVPGGPLRETTGPIVSTLSLTNVTPPAGSTGFAAAANLEYVVTFVDKFGQESLPSATRTVAVLAGRSVNLANIPVATSDYVARKIYRRSAPATPFQLVATLNRDGTTFVDNGQTVPGTLQTAGLAAIDRARRSASLVIDPGVVLKSAGGRIEVGIGATLIAEGTVANPIIFTSRLDDRYGAAGSFDTNNDRNASRGREGDWGGIVARHLSNVSLDNVVVTFGGGATRVPGGFASFNAIELHQSNARIANSVIENNANGRGTPGSTNRGARGVNDESAIFVVGSQPVILNNIIRNNAGGSAAISIDANSLNSESLRDFGRSTGLNARENVGIGNFGPLVNNNRLGGNSINGMRVRGATLTTESVWDDTDIVHVLTSEIVIPDFTNYGGLRLASKVDESLVIKIAGTNAGFTATGRPLDIKDRIGGSLQIIGTPGFPVVLTSLADDTIGAGFDFRGEAMLDTNNNRSATSPAPGSWRSVLITPFANDRNVSTVVERESDQLGAAGKNDTPAESQSLGVLAPGLQSGDENKRLGFTITGSVATPSDLDVFRFSGTAGTPVWFDIDQSSGSLDSIIELIDADGNIIALSNKSLDESISGTVHSNPAMIGPNRVLPMDQSSHVPLNRLSLAQQDFQGVNPLDAGMRVVLPGTAGTTNEYYVRVRSSNVSPVPAIVNGVPVDRSSSARLTDRSLVREGISTGVYKLQLRLQQMQEIAGTTVQFADVRYATTGIDIQGQPLRSALLGEVGEANPAETNAAPTSAIALGNVLNNDMGGLSIAGNIANVGDIDWYDFTISVDSIAPFSADYPTRNPHQSVVFDIDYAAGFGRPNTQLWVFQRVGTELLLIATGDSSNLLDDQPLNTNTSDNSDLSRGSRSTKDAYIGPFELLPGNYVVAVSNASLSHVLTEQFTQASPTQVGGNFVRYEPLDSVVRISEDRFDTLGRVATNTPPVQVAFGNANTTSRPNTEAGFFANAVPFNLSDVTMFATTARNVRFINPLTGAQEALYSTDGQTAVEFGVNTNAITDLAVAPNGFAIGFQNNAPGSVRQDNTSGTFFGIDIGNGAPAATASGITTFITRTVPASDPPTFETIQVPNNGGNNGIGMIFDGLAFSQQFATDQGGGQLSPSFWGVASRGSQTAFRQPILGGDNLDHAAGISNAGPATTQGRGMTRNVLYRLNSIADGNVGQARSPASGAPGVGIRNGAQQGLGAGTSIVEHGYFVRTPGQGGGLAAIHSWVDANGTVTGLAVVPQLVGTRYFAVTNQGELMSLLLTSEIQGQVWSDQYVEIRDPANNQLINFQSLTTGPRNVEGGRFANLLFGTDIQGRLWAFNTAGVLQPIFPRGAFFVQTGNAAIRGIDFSSLDVNLWHLSLEEDGTQGHGRLVSPNNSRDASGQNAALKFGYSNPTAGLGAQGGNWSGIYNMGPNNGVDLYGNTSLPGGARGALESHHIDLSQYSADDQPMLYFNYSLSTQGTNTAFGDQQAMLDSFRVYGAGEDGAWVLLATNNSARSAGSYDDTTNPDEFDVPVNANQDGFTRSYLSQELFDNAGWRQARVNLAPLAGKRDIRIRFEFATGGDFRTGVATLGGQELVAVPGERLRDGQTFEVGGTTFEFDMGLTLNLPSAASLLDGDGLFINGVPFIFRQTPVNPQDILLNPNHSPNQVAVEVATTLQANGFLVAFNTQSPNTLNVLNAGPLFNFVLNADPNIITGTPGVTGTNVPVLVNNSMDALEVREAIRTSLAAALNVPGQETNIDVYRVSGHSIMLHNLTIADQGPLGATIARRVGDFFGPIDTPNPVAGQSFRTQNNLNTVVFLDDIIIGFAERGEMVLGAELQTAAIANNLFVPTFEYQRIGGMDGAPADEIETGAYQLEIRSAASYGFSAGNDLSLETIPFVNIQLGRTFDTNDRLTKSIALQLNAASAIRDGATFTLSDGVNVVTFEFDVVSPTDLRRQGVDPANVAIVITPDATVGQVIRAVRDAINSPNVQAQIKVSASANGDMQFGAADLASPFTNVLQLSGNAAANLTGSFDFTTGGVPFNVIQHGQEISPLGTDFGEDMGDQNLERVQGQMIISATSVINSSGFGINVDAGTQSQVNLADGVGNRPYPGVPRNLVTLNAANVGLGPVLANNLLANNGLGGIRVSGDTANNANGNPPRTVARIVNNTLHGPTSATSGPSGVGILIEDGAIPTIVNTIISKFSTGIQYNGPATGPQPELGGIVYQSNTVPKSPVTLNESFELLLPPTAPLFIDSADGRFYLRALSPAIDSSINSVEDRSIIDQVKSPIGLPTSPILAPDFDIFGLRRVDDPAVNTPAGLGENVFTDRGAFERSDFVGPIAVLQRPIDNDANLIDADRTTTYLMVGSGNYDFFEVLLDETSGTGVDADTVTNLNIILTENGQQLVDGSDYVRGYSVNSRTIRLTPLAGFWRRDSVYELTLVNRVSHKIDAPSGRDIVAGQQIRLTVGTTSVVMEFDLGSGVSAGAIPIPVQANFTSQMVLGRIFQALSRSGLSISTNVVSNRSLLIFGASDVVLTGGTVGLSATLINPIRDIAGNLLQANRPNSLTQFTIAMPEVGFDFGDAIERSGTGATSSTVLTSTGTIVSGARHAMYPVDEPQLVLGRYADSDANGQTSPAADADDREAQISFSAGLGFQVTNAGPIRLAFGSNGPGLLGQSLTISDDANNTVVFRFVDNVLLPGPDEIAVNIATAVSALDVATAVQTAIKVGAIDRGLLFGITAILDGTSLVLGGNEDHSVSTTASNAFVQRVISGSQTIRVLASTTIDGETLTIVDGSGRTLAFQIVNTALANPAPLGAGNRPVSVNLSTATDASLAEALRLAINDAIRTRLINLPTIPASAIVGNEMRILANDEDGVTFDGFFNPFALPVEVTITSSGAGFVDVWIDWNQDNDFNDLDEYIDFTQDSVRNSVSVPVLPGQNILFIPTPSHARVGYTTARFRLSTTGGMLPSGMAIGGEVEDHVIEILPGRPPISVNDPNGDVTGRAREYRVIEDSTLVVSSSNGVLANDVNFEAFPLFVHDFDPYTPAVDPVEAPQNGTLTLNADGSFTYVPNRNFFGRDQFTYLARSTRMTSVAPATVTINVLQRNDAPLGVNDLETISEDNGDITVAPNTSVTWNVSRFTANDIVGFDAGDVNAIGGVIANETPIQSLRIVGARIVSPSRTGEQVAFDTVNNTLTFRSGTHYNFDIDGVVVIEIDLEDNGLTGVIRPDELNQPSALLNPDPLRTTSRITVTVNPLNDRPIFSLTNPIVMDSEDSGAQARPIIVNVAPGPALATDELATQQVVGFDIVVTANHPNPMSLFSVAPTITGSAASATRTLEYRLAPNVNRLVAGGDILLTVTARDNGPTGGSNVNESLPQTITIRVSEVNDNPDFDLNPTTFTVTEDASLQLIPQIYTNVVAGPSSATDENGQNVELTVSIPAGAAVLYSVLPRLNQNRDLEFQFAPDVNRNFAGLNGIPLNAFEIYLTATDNGEENGVPVPRSVTKTLVVDVTPINDAPSYGLSQNRINVVEDQGLIALPGFATNVRPAINATAIDENSQTLTFDLTFTNPALFVNNPSIDSAGRLTFRTAPDQNGTSIVTARLRDNGLAGPPPNSNLGPLLTFTISVDSINDAPEFTMPSTLQVIEDQGLVSVPGFATGIRPGPATAVDENRQVLTFQLISADSELFEVMPSMQTDGTLTFRTRANVNSNTPGINRVVQFQLRDNGVSTPAPNSNLSAILAFTLGVTPVNDPPIPGTVRVNGTEDVTLEVGPTSVVDIDDILANVEPGPEDEVNEGQTLRMTQIERTTVRGGQILPIFNAGVIVSFRYIPPTDLSGEDFVRYVVTDNGTPEASATGTITLDLQAVNDPPRFTAGPNLSLTEDDPAYRAAWATNIAAGPASALDELSGPNAQTVSFNIVNFNASFFAVPPAVSASGELSFTLAKDVNGTTVVEIAAVDSGSNVAPNNNRSAVHRLTIVVGAVNDAPGFVLGSAVSVAEDSGAYDAAFVTRIVAAEGMNNTPPTGQDESGQTVSFVVTNSNNNLFAVQPSITSAGRLRFVPAPNAFGVVTVTVVAQDSGPSTAPNQNSSAPRTFEINITQVQDAPFAVTDRYNTSEDVVLTISAPGLLANDIDPDLPDDVLRVAQPGTIQSTLGATVVLNADGSFSYDPRSSARIQGLTTGQTDVDTFTYTVRDRADLSSNVGTVSITLTGVNDAPVAVNDRFVVATGVPVNLAILDNDRDVDTPIDVGTVVIGILPLNGSVTILPSGRVQYTPRAGFVGEDTFSYRVRDSLGALSNEATVQVISGVSPRAADDLALTSRNVPIEINIVQNDTAFSGTLDLSTLQIASGPDTGTVVLLGNGVVRYTPATNFVGAGSFQYFLSDTNGIPSNLATVTVRVVSSLNQNPTNRFDVDNDGFVSPIDALILINDINLNGDRVLPASTTRPPFLDVDGDGSLSPLDVLAVVNFINEQGNAAGEGEGIESLGWFENVQIMSPAQFAEVCDADLTLQIEREIGNYLATSLDDSIEMGPMQYLGDIEEDEDESLENLLVAAHKGEGDVNVPSILDDLFAADWS